jgi:16S rRNA (cytosine1402-N4)-methyltransferase
MNEEHYHEPVMLKECLDGLVIEPDGIYVDVTYGGGGHSKAILNQLGENGHLFGFDQDIDATTQLIQDDRLTFVQHNFRFLKRFLRLEGVTQVDGILADLGVSSHQLNEAERGFSYRFDALLDMRMNQVGEVTAADILRTYNVEQLQQIFSDYGEVRNAKTLAQAIVAERENREIKTITDFLTILGPLVRGRRARYLAQVFQALRIEVNDEMGALRDFLTEALEVLKPGGRLVVMSYHSLEDRYVKNFIKKGSFDGEFIKNDFGKIYRPFKIITKKAVEASAEELKINSRARSAKLRIAEKTLDV